MKNKITYKYKLIDINKNKKDALNLTFRRYRRCVNYYIHQLGQVQIEKKGEIPSDWYYKARDLYGLSGALTQSARDTAWEQYLSWFNNEDNSKYPHFYRFIPIRLHSGCLSFKNKQNHFDWWASISTINGRVHVPITSGDKYLEKLNEDFKSAQLIFKDGEYYLNVTFEEESNIPDEEDFEHFIGVDMGERRLATIVVQDREGNILESQFFSGKKASAKRKHYNKLRKELGKKKKLKKIKEMKDKEYQYMKDKNHKISKRIIDIAKKYDNSVIIMERLKGIRDRMRFSTVLNRRVHAWAYRELQDFVTYKAHKNGIAIRTVNPAYTSKVCRNCFDKNERVSQSKYVCKTCKKEYNADWLGAVNIVRRLFFYMKNGAGDKVSRPKQGDVERKGSTAQNHYGLVEQLSGSQP